MPDDPRLRIFPDEFVPNVEASDAYKRWAKSSPGDRARWESFRDALLADPAAAVVPAMSTKLGKALAAAGKEHMSISSLVGQVTNPYPPVPPTTGQFYVSTTGSDSAGDGSAGSPWQTIKKACDTVTSGLGATINVAAGTYVETATCLLPTGTRLLGAGQGVTIVRAASAFTRLMQAGGNDQTISDLTLDGQNRTTAMHGLWAQNVTNLKILRVTAQGFPGSGGTIPNGLSGGGINLQSATDSEIGYCTITNSGSFYGTSWATGALGVGSLTRCTIHDCAINTDAGYAVKSAGTAGAIFLRNTVFYNNTFQTATWPLHPDWDLCFELWGVSDSSNVEIRNNTFDRPLSLVAAGGALSQGSIRYNVHHNIFAPLTNYSIESVCHNSEYHHNYFNGGYTAFASFGTETVQYMNVHHNVFDNIAHPNAPLAENMEGVCSSHSFDDNTVVLRGDPGKDVLMLNGGAAGSSGAVRRNIFRAVSVTANLGYNSSLNGFTIDNNAFYGGIAATGTNQITGDPLLPLTGGFPSAYVPGGGSPAIGIGAMADGTFAVGPA